eukprot:c9865_g1_i1 orf=1-162(-)
MKLSFRLSALSVQNQGCVLAALKVSMGKKTGGFQSSSLASLVSRAAKRASLFSA